MYVGREAGVDVGEHPLENGACQREISISDWSMKNGHFSKTSPVIGRLSHTVDVADLIGHFSETSPVTGRLSHTVDVADLDPSARRLLRRVREHGAEDFRSRRQHHPIRRDLPICRQNQTRCCIEYKIHF